MSWLKVLWMYEYAEPTRRHVEFLTGNRRLLAFDILFAGQSSLQLYTHNSCSINIHSATILPS